MDVYLGEVSQEIGLGVFAGRDFRKGDLVLRATGVITGQQTAFSIQVDWDLHLEPDPPAKYLNHSCTPSMGVRCKPGEAPEFFALRDIRCGEQVTFDYAMTEFRHYPRKNPANEFSLVCLCGATGCRGRLGYFSELPDEIKQKYLDCSAGYLVDTPRQTMAWRVAPANKEDWDAKYDGSRAGARQVQPALQAAD